MLNHYKKDINMSESYDGFGWPDKEIELLLPARGVLCYIHQNNRFLNNRTMYNNNFINDKPDVNKAYSDILRFNLRNSSIFENSGAKLIATAAMQIDAKDYRGEYKYIRNPQPSENGRAVAANLVVEMPGGSIELWSDQWLGISKFWFKALASKYLYSVVSATLARESRALDKIVAARSLIKMR